MRALLLPLLFASVMAARAQSAAQLIAWGDHALQSGDTYGASRFYGEALDLEPGTLDLQWRYAEACRRSEQYPQAAEQYAKVYRKDQGRRYPEALRWLAEMQLCAGGYEEAAKTWAKVKQKEKDKRSVVAQRADHALEGCRLAVEWMGAPEDVTIEHLAMPVNSYDSEFAPRIGPDSLLYFSSLRGGADETGEVGDTTLYHVGILRVDPDRSPLPEPTWTTTRLEDEANVAWSADGTWRYSTRCPGNGRPCMLMAAHAVGGAFQAPVPVTGIAATSASTQPMVAMIDGVQCLFFTSDAPGGLGGTDIWTARLDGAALDGARPLGAPVNTPGNEATPFFDADQRKLYFSSDFLPGLGGFDNFMSELKDGTYSAPVNFGHPLNSPANDLYPTFDAATMTGWFTSNRKGSFSLKNETCCNDLYRYSYPGVPPLAQRPLPPLPNDTALLGEDPGTDAVLRRITSLRGKLPIRLYFHNDEPGPRSMDTTTAVDYATAYRAYKALLPDYRAAWKESGTEAIDAFFRDEVDRGFAQLNDFIALLEEALAEGQHIELSVRGFASPLAKTDYNRNLSLRRIHSLVGYLRIADQGRLRPYLDGTAPNGGRLTVHRSPFGEDTSARDVSDRLEDLRNSVYGVGASRERRIEIEQVGTER